MKQSQLNEPCYISITWLPPRVEISKKIFVIAYHYTFTSFTIPSSYFQVFYIFIVLSFLYTFWFCLAFAFSGFTFLLYYQVFYFFVMLSILPISLNVFRFSMSFILSGFSKLSIFSNFLHYLFFYVFFLSRKCFIYRFLYEAIKCVSHTNDVEGLMLVVRYPPEWTNILRLSLFETAISGQNKLWKNGQSFIHWFHEFSDPEGANMVSAKRRNFSDLTWSDRLKLPSQTPPKISLSSATASNW